MQPAVRACLALAALAALTGSSPGRQLVRVARPAPRASASAASSAAPGPVAVPCPSGALPDGDGCVPFGQAAGGEGASLESQINQHHDRRGQLKVYEQIPRQPDRPETYESYRYPIPTAEGTKLAISGFDLDLPDEQQRRGSHLKAVGHGGVDLAAPRGTEVRALPIEHQEGDAEVIYTGQLFGLTVVTRHARKEGERLQEYVILHGHLDGIAPGLGKGTRVPSGTLLGFVGDSGSEGVVHLHLEIRRVREGEDAAALPPGKLTANDRTIAVDPRNLLPLR